MKTINQNMGKRRKRKVYGVVCCATILSACLSAGCAGKDSSANGPSAAPSGQAVQESEPQQVAEAAVQERAGQETEAQTQKPSENAVSEQPQQEQPKQEPQTQEQPTQQPQQQPSSADNAQGAGTQTDIGLEQAKTAALAHAGLEAADVTFIKEEQDYDDGRLEYEVEFVTAETKYEYEINANDGSILKSSREPIVQKSGAAQTQNGITQEEAKKAALDYAGLSEEQVAFSKVELDHDDGITEYEIEFYVDKKEYSFSINAATGEILEVEIDLD